MHCNFNPFSLMGLSNVSDMFLSENDLNTMDFSFLVKPTCQIDHECQFSISSSSEENQEVEVSSSTEEEEEKEEKGERFEILFSKCLELKLPIKLEESNEIDQESDADDGFKTPTSLNHKISKIPHCPPAPRKPKSVPSTSSKRKACGGRILLDLSSEIELMFPSAFHEDLSGKVKKFKHGNKTI